MAQGDEAKLGTDLQAGFIAGVHCIGCWSPTEPCPINVRYAEDQHPRVSKKYPLCIRCNKWAWEYYGGQAKGT